MNAEVNPSNRQTTASSPARKSAQSRAPLNTEPQVFVASQWKLVWWRFRQHRVALASLAIVILIYGVAAFPDFLAPYPADTYASAMLYAPPQPLRLTVRDGDRPGLQLYVYGLTSTVDARAFRRVFEVDYSHVIDVRLFAHGAPYRLLGVFPTDLHLMGPVDTSEMMCLLGADRLGRDVLSRTIHGTGVSMSIGLIGVIISLVLGILLGGLSGYYGGAALPMDWSPLRVYLGITVILSFTSWTGLARVVRGKFLSLREEEFVMAAELDGAPEVRIILRYMLPSFASHIIAYTTLAVPRMILSETSLSFLGLGLRAPVVSWGVLLKEAQSVRAIVTAPWLLTPALSVVTAVTHARMRTV